MNTDAQHMLTAGVAVVVPVSIISFDLVLSDNPLTVDPDAIVEIDVLMTMVGGNVEHCLEDPEDPEWVCPDP